MMRLLGFCLEGLGFRVVVSVTRSRVSVTISTRLPLRLQRGLCYNLSRISLQPTPP